MLLENVLTDDEIERIKNALYRIKDSESLDGTRVYLNWRGEHHAHMGNLVEYDPALLEYACTP